MESDTPVGAHRLHSCRLLASFGGLDCNRGQLERLSGELCSPASADSNLGALRASPTRQLDLFSRSRAVLPLWNYIFHTQGLQIGLIPNRVAVVASLSPPLHREPLQGHPAGQLAARKGAQVRVSDPSSGGGAARRVGCSDKRFQVPSGFAVDPVLVEILNPAHRMAEARRVLQAHLGRPPPGHICFPPLPNLQNVELDL